MADGPVIAEVVPGGTAAAIGMQTGDIVLQAGGQPASGTQAVGAHVLSLKVGDRVWVLVSGEVATWS